MKKKVIAVLIVLLTIIMMIFVINKIKAKKIDYEISKIQKYNYFKYYENEKYGVIDKEGKLIIKAEHEDIVIPNPEYDIFVCYNKDKPTIMNSEGNVIFEQYESVDPIELKNIVSVLSYEKTVLKYRKDGKYGLIDFKGKEITKNIYNSIENLQSSEGKFLVSKNDKYGVINLNGKILVNTEYDNIKSDEYFSEETGYVNAGFITSNKTSEGNRYGYINYNGKKLLKEEYNDIVRIPDQQKVYLIVSKDGRYGLYQNSKKIINTEYQEINYCEDNALIIRKNKSYGIANIDGKVIVDVKYSNIESKGIYLYAQNSNERKVYDKVGNIIDINYDKIVYNTSNSEYRIYTLENNDVIYYGIENSNGKELVSPLYSYIEYTYNNYFIAKNDKGQLGVINANGKVLIDFKYDSLQKIKEKNLIQAIDSKSKKTEIYSSDLKVAYTMSNDTKISNENGYIAIFDKEQTIYLNNDGKVIKEDSDELKNIKLKSFPDKIGKYKKVEASLDNIYYVQDLDV